MINSSNFKLSLKLFSKGAGFILLKVSLNLISVFLCTLIYLKTYKSEISRSLLLFFFLFYFLVIIFLNRILTKSFFKKISKNNTPKFFILFSPIKTFNSKREILIGYIAEIALILFISLFLSIFSLPIIFYYKKGLILLILIASSIAVSTIFIASTFPYLLSAYLISRKDEKTQ